MTLRKKREAVQPELSAAIALTWGFLRAQQYEDALRLARGCLAIWPNEKRLLLMAAAAAVELLEPLDERMREALETAECSTWTKVIQRRAKLAELPSQNW